MTKDTHSCMCRVECFLQQYSIVTNTVAAAVVELQDLAACDKLHVEGNLQGPLNFSIAFIPLSCSRRDEMGSVSFFFPASLIHGSVTAGVLDKRPTLPDSHRHSSLLFFSSSLLSFSSSDSPPDLQVLEMKRGRNDVHSSPQRCGGTAAFFYTLNVADMDLC